MEQESLCSALESILFAAEHPVSLKRFKDVFGEENCPEDEAIISALESIENRYQDEKFGFELRKAQSGFHFVTKAKNVEYVRTFLAAKPFRISKSAAEVLAIVAYRQPITRADVDQIRGIDSSHIMRVLMERGVVKMAGKAEVPGRPVQYATTDKFLEIVGLSSVNDLPPLSELEQLQGHAEPARDPLEVGLEKFVKASQSAGKMEEASVEELQEINDMLTEADDTSETDIYESAAHQQVAQSNKEALEAMRGKGSRKKKKKSKEDSVEASEETVDTESKTTDSAESQGEVRYEDLVPDSDAKSQDPVTAFDSESDEEGLEQQVSARSTEGEQSTNPTEELQDSELMPVEESEPISEETVS